MMSRVIVISDTHGSTRVLRQIILNFKDSAVCFIHCGDGEDEVEKMKQEFPDITIHAVCGNCDFSSNLPVVSQVTVAGREIVFTHGHTHQVVYGTEVLKEMARNVGADIALYGHTHVGYTEYDDGLHVMNPGSPVQPRDNHASFGVIDIGDQGIVCRVVRYGGM